MAHPVLLCWHCDNELIGALARIELTLAAAQDDKRVCPDRDGVALLLVDREAAAADIALIC